MRMHGRYVAPVPGTDEINDEATPNEDPSQGMGGHDMEVREGHETGGQAGHEMEGEGGAPVTPAPRNDEHGDQP